MGLSEPARLAKTSGHEIGCWSLQSQFFLSFQTASLQVQTEVGEALVVAGVLAEAGDLAAVTEVEATDVVADSLQTSPFDH